MHILIIDDEKNIGVAISEILDDEGHSSKHALNFSDGLKLLKKEVFDALFLDIWLPDIDGVEGLREVKRYYPEIEVVMISGHGTIETAVDTLRYGAYDFLEKPLSLDRIVMILKHLKDRFKLLKDLRKSKYNLIKKYNLIGVSSEINRLRDKIDKVSNMNSWVLIIGENGTGKEHVSRLIHMLGKRSNKSFIEINCSAIPKELIESELFGYEKGAFTGATTTKRGKFELADGGTLFLDEIGDMDISMQSKLLKVLETGEFSRLGSNDVIRSDFRLISATNKDLELEISSNRFRTDLYYRINVIPIEVPALRDRKEDIPYLVAHFLKESLSINILGNKTISDSLMHLLIDYNWHGNVRQLKNIIERMVVLSDNDILDINDAPKVLISDGNKSDDISNILDYKQSLKDARDDFEKDYILNVLNKTNWNILETSKILDLERTYLYKKMKHFCIEKPIDI